MRYFVAKFHISDKEGHDITKSDLLQTARDILATMVAEAGFESFEDTSKGINGYVQTTLFRQDVLDKVILAFPVESLQISYEMDDVEENDWNAVWEQEGFEPIIIGDRCVIHDLSRQADKGYALEIVIDAKQAFGTGTHETTRMIVAALLDMDLKGKRVLDCGCGTGILSIVAAKCGAREVIGYDIDEWSTRNTEHNAELNHVRQVEVLLGDISVLSHVSGVFDVILANINRNILMNDMPVLKELMTHGTHFIISGFYQEDAPLLAEEAGNLGMRLIRSDSQNNWCMLEFVTE